MSLFGAIVRTAVNVATLPVAVVRDVVCWPADDGEVGRMTKATVQKIKDESETKERP